MELATRNPRRAQFLDNVDEFFAWCKSMRVAPGLAGNLAIGLFAKERAAIETLKYNGGDSFEKKALRAHNAARDVMYYERLLSVQHNLARDTGGGALYATADAGIFQVVKLNKLDYWTVEGGQAFYGCSVYPDLELLLSPSEREAVSRPAFPSAAHVPPSLEPEALVALIEELTRATVCA